MPLQRFPPHGCLWTGVVRLARCTPVILQWNGLIDCCAPLFTFPASEQVLFSPRPLFPSVLPSPFQLPSSHQVQVHPGVTSCLVARDNQTAVYVTIISKALIPLSFCPSLIPLSLLPFLLFSFWPAFCPSDAMRSAPSGPRCKYTSYWFNVFSDPLAPPTARLIMRACCPPISSRD